MQFKIIKIATKIKGQLNLSLKKFLGLLKLPKIDEISKAIKDNAGAAAKNNTPN